MPLAKSYSETAGLSSRKNRAGWQRSRSNPINQRPTGPPARISEVTRNKLEKLKFQPPPESLAPLSETNKENIAVPKTSLPVKDAPPVNQTPVTRLRWKDLGDSGGAKDDFLDISPSDRVVWAQQEVGDMLFHLPDIQPPRGKKRARSSSPTSSPLTAKETTPLVNVKKLAQAVRSSNADPTLELWDRYSTAGAVAPLAISNPALAQILASSSSPRPSRSASGPQGEPSGLRRSLSCRQTGNKRRRILGSDLSPLNNQLDQLDGEVSKSSLLTSLLDTVHTSIQDTSVSPEPESPSPQKKTQRRTSSPAAVSSPSRPDSKHGVSETRQRAAHPLPADHSDVFCTDVKISVPASDYGDDDFDDDIFMELAETIEATATQPLNDQSRPQSPQRKNEPDEGIREIKPESEYAETDFDDDILVDLAGGSLDSNLTIFEPPTTTKLDDIDGGRPGLSTTDRALDLEHEGGNEFDDEFGDDFGNDFDFEAVELAAVQSSCGVNSSLPVKNQNIKAIQRYLIKKVFENQYVDSNGRSRLEKMLSLESDTTKVVRIALLRDEWFDTEADEGAYVHIIGQFNRVGECVIDDSQNIIVIHPDRLVSATVVADSFTCMRRAVLQDRIKATSEPTPPLVYGTILHEIFQEALTAMRWDPPFLSQVIETVLEKHVEDLYIINIGTASAREHLQSKMPELSQWADTFVSTIPKPEAMVQDRNDKKVNMSVNKLLDVEEHIWSPMYGLKGNIDATVQVTVKDGLQMKQLTVPFEVKTGRHANPNHMAQTALYNLLLSDRYDIEVTCGVLYYMESSNMFRIPSIRRELRQMIMQRNRLAAAIRDPKRKKRNDPSEPDQSVVALPPMIKQQHMCGRCYAKTSCFVYHRFADDGDGESSGLGAKFDEVVRHLTPTHKQFFLKWESLLTTEEGESHKVKRELWTMISADREKIGRCFSDVVISEVADDKDTPKINRFRYTFVKRVHPPGFSFMESQLTVGEPVVVSDEKGHFALAMGFVTKVRKDRITVAVDRRLHNARVRQPGFDEVNNQVFAGVMDASSSSHTTQVLTDDSIRYRLDKDEFSNGMALVRNNLVQIMANGVVGAQKTRRLVVDLAPPKFKACPTQYNVDGHGSLNVDQQNAIAKVMSAEDYALVLGMPGTGKTTTIAHIIRALHAQGKTVLLTSYTHTAVDNILLKLRSDKIGILRLGAPAKVHPDVEQFATLAGKPAETIDDLKKAWASPIVATTCLGINHPIFTMREFDYCIVDEASQITLPVCLGPIRFARTFVLVGDHNQLPPLVQNEEARKGGLDVSLFKTLSETHPDSVVNLEHQYRMCEDIMTLSNTLIYKGRLRCGTEELRWSKLEVPNMAGLRQLHHDASTVSQHCTPKSICPGPTPSHCWLRDLVDSEARVRFVNTDTLVPRPREEAKGNRIVNAAEARVVAQLVEALISTGVPESEIGVMTHYRSQLALLRHHLHPWPGVEMHTADRFQGRDKEVVVLSLVRSNEACSIGDLLRDWRRINVAFTRAKTKLLVVGSRETLGNSGEEEMLAKMVKLVEGKGWLYDLPADALDTHRFSELYTQSLRTSPKKKNSPRKISARPGPLADTENIQPAKRLGANEKVLLKNRPVTRDILNEMTDGAYSYT